MKSKFIQQIWRAQRPELSADLRNEKIIIIEDIMRAKRCAVGMGLNKHNLVLSDPMEVFDQLYDIQYMFELRDILTEISREISAKARILAGIDSE